MTQRDLNLWGGLEPEELERYGNIDRNFTEVMQAYTRNYATELLAAKGGVQLGEFYHNAGALQVRFSLIPVPGAGVLSLYGSAPVVLHTMSRAPGAGSLTLTGIAPVKGWSIAPQPQNLAISGGAPVLS
jgi:hypothetical protein